MKTIKLLSVVAVLFFAIQGKAQNPCQASITFTFNSPTSDLIALGSLTGGNASTTYTCFWDFGNGTTYTTNSITQTLSTTYTINSIYPVSLLIESSNPNCYASKTEYVTVASAACPLVASALSSITGGTAGTTVNFNNQTTGIVSTTSYTWDFGDGSTSNLSNPPAHTYTANGNYAYTLTASNNGTCNSFSTGNNIICAYTPTLSYTAGTGGVINFTTSGAGPGCYVQYEFGDGTYLYGYNSSTLNISNIQHTYFNGTYVPIVMVNPGGVCSNTAAATAITVTGNACYADAAFTYTAGSGGAVQFSKTSPPTSGNIAYFWKFGDGSTSTLVNPTHTYVSAGNYSVSLLSYDATYSIIPWDTSYFSLPCRDLSATNLNITGIPCVANSNFSLYPFGQHAYYIIPDYPYNVSSAVWDWGDGTTSNSLYSYHQYATPGNYNICLTVTTSCGATGSTCATQSLLRTTADINDMVYVNVIPPQFITGINNQVNESVSLSIFPNPNNGIINIKPDKAVNIQEVAIYDLVGSSVYQATVNSNEETLQLDVSTLTNGIYFMRVKLPNSTLTSKLVISK